MAATIRTPMKLRNPKPMWPKDEQQREGHTSGSPRGQAFDSTAVLKLLVLGREYVKIITLM